MDISSPGGILSVHIKTFLSGALYVDFSTGILIFLLDEPDRGKTKSRKK